MTSKEKSYALGPRLDLKNNILESYSSSLRRNLTSSLLSKSSSSDICKPRSAETINNVILQTNKISLQNEILTSSRFKRKVDHDDLVHSKRKLTSPAILLHDQTSCLLQKKYFHLQTTLPSENQVEVKNDTIENDSFDLKNIVSDESQPVADQMPSYAFSPLSFDVSLDDEFISTENRLADHISEKKKDEELLKVTLLTLVSTSLMYSPNFRDLNNEFCQLLLSIAEEVASEYPEFILKVALYTRQELNIRTTANFLLAYAAFNVNCRCYLKRYFKTSICLPSDWLEVAEICKELCLQKSVAFPSALRKVMVDAFTKFDNYQLAKYNRDPIKKKKRKQKQRLKREMKKDGISSRINVDDQENAVSSKQIYTLKRLIQLLHIRKPVEHVMCILGKKYPMDFESFKKSRLPGNWEKEKAGKRMKLPIPETWETELSAHGNKAAVWEKLLDKRKLPYMAMLRNIRNLLITGISKKHHKQVLKKLCEERAVVKSRQFPLRFFAAYEAIHQLEVIDAKKHSAENCKYMIPKKRLPNWKKKLSERLHHRANNIDAALLKEYRTAIDTAVEIACRNNIDPIEGRTLVICDVLSCSTSECQSLKGSLVDKMHQACILLATMISYAAEECELKIIKSAETWHTMNVTNDSILENVLKLSKDITISETEDDLKASVKEFYDENLSSLLEHYLCPAVVHVQFDQIVLLTSGKYFDDTNGNSIINDFLKKYRILLNKQLLFVKVDLTGKQKNVTQLSDPYDVMLYGFSDQLLRFISERGNGQQLCYIENIDAKYELKPMPKARPFCDEVQNDLQSIIISNQIQKWETARVFISSTFKDMHGERDLIVRYIIPELRVRAKTLHVNIQEVDLRWGVTEAESANDKALEICLSEASRCEFFLGILGERYGQVCDYVIPDDPEFQWLKEYPPGASVTELEIYCAALSNSSAAANNSFFYFRDKSFAEKIPDEWKPDFFEESEYNIKKLNLLKEKIKCNGLEVFENYPCTWGGIINGIPVVANLDEFGERILQNLWNAFCKHYKKKQTPLIDQKISPLHTSYAEEFQPIIGQADFRELCAESILKNDGIFLITGKSGSGKTALMRELSKENYLQPNFPYFFGVDSRSCYVHNMLKDLTLSLYSYLNFENIPPSDYQDLVNSLPSILETAIELSESAKLIIFIDGLDQFMHEYEVLDWLPCSLPKGVKMVFSASEDSSTYTKLTENLMKNKEYYQFSIKPLSLLERQKIVTNHLEPYRKVLDSSPFNNQLLMLTNKRDAGYPLYLYLACEELRTFGLFEKLTIKLRNYPQTISLLLKEILTQLENFHGKNLVKMALSLLGISPEGLSENELHILLSFITCTKVYDLPFKIMVAQIRNLKPESILSPLKFSSLLRTLRGLLQVSGNDLSDTLRITHSEILKSIQELYIKKSNGKITLILHRLLAAYFYNELMPKEFGDISEEISVRLFRLLPYHLSLSEEYKNLCNILCNISYIKAALKAGMRSEMLDYYRIMKKLNVNNMEQKAMMDKDISKKIDDYYCFLSCNLHILQNYPHLIYQQGVNEPHNSSVHKDCLFLPDYRIIKWMTKPQSQSLCYFTLSGFKQAIVTVAASPDGKTASLGTGNGAIHIIDILTGKLLRTFTGHSQIITSLCFIGNEQLCSCSADCTLNIWNITKGHRIHILRGHSRRVSACCSTACGRNIISISWDCTLRVWNVKDGQQLSVVKKTKYPLTCLSHHPYEALVVTGGWDTKLQIWDLINITKKAVLKGHSASVRSVTFSPCGQTIASASLNGEIFYWSFAQGIQIGKISANSGYPATCLSFTKSGDKLITGSNENILKVWSFKRGTVVQQQEINELKIHCLKFLSLEYIAIGCKNGMCIVIEVNTGYQYWQCHDIKDAITCLEPYFDENSVCLLGCIIGSSNGSILLANFQEKSQHSTTVYQEITAAVIFKENIIAGAGNGEIFMISLLTFELHTITAHQNAITKCLVNQDQLITVSKDHGLKIWHLVEDCGLVQQTSLPHCHGDWITACICTDDILITGSQDCTIKLWKIGSWENKAVLSELKSPINHMALEGNYIIGGTRNGGIGVWNKQGKFIASLPPYDDYGVTHIAHITKSVSSEKYEKVYQHLLASADDNHLIIRKPFSKMLLVTLPCHTSPVSSFCVTSDDKVLSCSFSDKVQFWKVGNYEENSRKSIMHHEAIITSVGISPDADFAFSADAKGKLIVWTLDLYEENPLSYGIKKEWECGSIPSAMFTKSGRHLLIMCAVTRINDTDHKEYFAVSLKLKYSFTEASDVIQRTTFDLKECESCNFTDEVLSMDANRNSIAFGLKSGVVVIADKLLKIQKMIKVSNNWIIGTMFSSYEASTIYATALDEILKLKSCNSKNLTVETWRDFDDDISLPNAYCMTDDKWCIGTNDGLLCVFDERGCFREKIHSGAVNDISVCCDFIFTCSDDNSIKIWKATFPGPYLQVGHFYFPVPVTVLATFERRIDEIIIIFGTKIGEVHLLIWNSILEQQQHFQKGKL